jgi:phage shock protein PspC (stress-responsive transcriptional regulator)
MAKRLRAFLDFLYDFVIGDDWRIAVGVVAGLALTYAVSQSSVPAWWLLPVLLVVLLPASLWLAVRHK